MVAGALAGSPFLLVGVAWLVGGPAVVWLEDRRERA
jgi:hypothetical protein